MGELMDGLETPAIDKSQSNQIKFYLQSTFHTKNIQSAGQNIKKHLTEMQQIVKTHPLLLNT